MSVQIRRLTGAALEAGLSAVARLRIAVFRDWPYLYDGDLDYERTYLASFGSGPGAIIIAAYDGGDIVGAATAAPLAEHTEAFGALFLQHGLDPGAMFYLGESVLLEPYRGQGIGHAFFDHREAHAHELMTEGRYRFTHSVFCGVVRDDADPRCPTGYRPLDGFWNRRGYRKVEGLVGHYDWQELGDVEETRKPMQFWMRQL